MPIQPRPRALSRLSVLSAAALAALAPAVGLAANSELDVANNGASDLTAAGSYTQNTAPATTSDVTFDNVAYTNTAFTANSALGIGTLNDLSPSALTISGAGPITLNGGSNTVAPSNGGAAADLLFVASAANLSSSAPITLTTAVGSGNFDVAGTGAATISGAVGGSGGFTKTGAGSLTLSAANTYTGGTNVSAGTLVLSGAQTAAVGQFIVGNVAGSTGTLDIQNGTYALGANAFFVGNSATGIVNQTGGAVTFTSGNALLLGNGGGVGTYNLSAGSLTGYASTSRGVVIGVNAGSTAAFNLSGSGTLNLTTGGNEILQVGRSDSTATGTTDTYSQTGGTATVGILAIGGSASSGNTGINATFSVTGGTFAANTFTVLGSAGANTINMTLGGGAQVTLPAFPTATTALGSGATANLTFDGGILIPNVSSTAYLSGLTSASITNNGATINTNGFSINVGQALQNASGATGALTKTGAGVLGLFGANTYTGGTNVSAGVLTYMNTVAQPATGTTTVASGAALALGVGGTGYFSSTNVDSLFANTLPNVTLNSGAVIGIDTSAGNFTYSTNQSTSTRAFYKLGANTLTLSAPVSDTGIFTVLAGTATLTGNNSGRSTSVNGLTTITSGSTLQLQANSGNTASGVSTALAPEETANQPLIIQNGGTLQLRSDSNVTFAGGNNFGGLGSASVTIDVNQITAGNVNNTLTLAPGGFNTGTTTINVTGGNGYALTLGNIGTGNNTPLALNPSTANLNIGSIPSTVTTLTKGGADTLVLTSTDAHTGATTISAGTLQVGAGAAAGTLSSSAVSLVSGATLAFDRPDTVSVPNVISGVGNFSQLGSGTVVLSGASTYTGNTAVTSGILQVGAGAASGAISGNTTVTLASGGSLVFNRSDVVSQSGAITGAGSLTQIGGGTLVLGGANTYTGATNVTNGTLRLGPAGANAPAVANGSFETPALGANSFTYSGSFTSAQLSSFAWTPGGNSYVAGSNNTGPVLINTSAAWAYTTPYPNGSQEVSIQRDASVTQSLNFASPGFYTVSWAAEERSAQTNPGVLTLDGGVVYSFTAPSSAAYTTYSATIYVPTAGSHSIGFAGTVTASDQSYALDNVALAAASGGMLPATTVVNLAGQSASGGAFGTLDLVGTSQTIAGLSGGGISGTGASYGTVTNSGVADSTLTVTGASVFAGVIADGATNKVALAKTTAGTLVLSGASTFSGPTTVSGGTLSVTGSLGATAVTVSAGGTLAGTGTIAGPASATGGFVAPGGGGSVGVLTLTSGLTLASPATLSVLLDPANSQGNGTTSRILTAGVVNLDSDGGAGSALALTLLSAPTTGEKFTIVDDTGSAALSGKFAQGATVTATFAGATYSFAVNYADNVDSGATANDVTLTANAVPEPAVAGLLGAAGLGLLGRRRRRVRVDSRRGGI